MGLIPVDAEYHYVQDTAPTTANAGDVWLDTSVNPPVAKIYADVGVGLEWLRDQSSDRIATNLDAPVSGAGATQTDIENGVDSSTTGSTVASNLDAPVSQAGQGVDWSSKTPQVSKGPVNISGSGYLTNVSAAIDDFQDSIGIEIDGNKTTLNPIKSSTYTNYSFSFFHRFESSLNVSEDGGGVKVNGVMYVLD